MGTPFSHTKYASLHFPHGIGALREQPARSSLRSVLVDHMRTLRVTTAWRPEIQSGRRPERPHEPGGIAEEGSSSQLAQGDVCIIGMGWDMGDHHEQSTGRGPFYQQLRARAHDGGRVRARVIAFAASICTRLQHRVHGRASLSQRGARSASTRSLSRRRCLARRASTLLCVEGRCPKLRAPARVERG